MRITIKDLKAVAERLNRVTGSPLESYKRDEEGKLRSLVGNYHISQAYGGYSLYRMANEAGGVSDVFYSGHVPARDLYNQMQAFIRGIEFNKGG
jgi:hypothetical protein